VNRPYAVGAGKRTCEKTQGAVPAPCVNQQYCLSQFYYRNFITAILLSLYISPNYFFISDSPILYTSPAPTVRMMSPGSAMTRSACSISAKVGKNTALGSFSASSAEDIPPGLVSRAA
jgi:hypothetical protein